MEKEKSIGGFWKKATKGNELYLAGQIEIGGAKYNIVAFKNSFRTDENNQPDYRIYFQRPKDQQPQTPSPAQAANDVPNFDGQEMTIGPADMPR